MKNNHAVLPFVMSGLAFVCFLLAAILMSTAVQPLWGQTLLLLLPAAVLCAIGFFARGGILSSRVTEVLTAVLSVLFLLLSLGYVFFLSLRAATTVTTDTKFYEMKTPRLIQFNYSSAGQPRGYISVKRVHFAGRVKPGCFCYMEVAA